ncbi:hypothetical protein [Capnocytophaga cynodegmi]|nr:hypothetical protein [Capnocytophaga cynodegmi]
MSKYHLISEQNISEMSKYHLIFLKYVRKPFNDFYVRTGRVLSVP